MPPGTRRVRTHYRALLRFPPALPAIPLSPLVRSFREVSTSGPANPPSAPPPPKLHQASTIDPAEVRKFSELASTWWDPDGPSRMLRLMNGARVKWVRATVETHFGKDVSSSGLDGLRVLDLGCGGGFLSEALARLGASVVAVDAAKQNIQVALAHASTDPALRNADGTCVIDYRNTTAEVLVQSGEKFDVVCAMEIVEHVSDPAHFTAMCSELLNPGSLLLMSTIAQNPLSYFLTIFVAERALAIVPPGTHDYSKFIQPDDLSSMMVRGGLAEVDRKGVAWNPLTQSWDILGDRPWDTSANYFMAGVKK